mmetsp:Transcript_11361/g.40306  ORF Transcript_11361/g.40306 Transcript_11361/m.40306 type:complete len:239 (-) Transcript_11361:1089-1805(-)
MAALLPPGPRRGAPALRRIVVLFIRSGDGARDDTTSAWFLRDGGGPASRQLVEGPRGSILRRGDGLPRRGPPRRAPAPRAFARRLLPGPHRGRGGQRLPRRRPRRGHARSSRGAGLGAALAAGLQPQHPLVHAGRFGLLPAGLPLPRRHRGLRHAGRQFRRQGALRAAQRGADAGPCSPYGFLVEHLHIGSWNARHRQQPRRALHLLRRHAPGAVAGGAGASGDTDEGAARRRHPRRL